jgi:hypothetical protein
MRVLFGFPGWGWKMYGLASFRSGSMWFVGFSKQLPRVGAGEAAGVSIDDSGVALWRCTKCGRVGTVGRCCGEETREPAQLHNV